MIRARKSTLDPSPLLPPGRERDMDTQSTHTAHAAVWETSFGTDNAWQDGDVKGDDDDDGVPAAHNVLKRGVAGHAQRLPELPTPSPDGGSVILPHNRHGHGEPLTRTLKLAAATAAIGGFLFGYDIGVISGALLQLREEFSLNDSSAEMLVSSLLLGAVAASITGGHVCDWVGRRNAIILNAGLFIVSAVWLAASSSVTTLILARILVGYAVSLSAIAECVYLSEIAPPSRRGQLVSLNELGITMGIMSAYAVNFALIDTRGGWRLMFAAAVIPASVQAVGMTQLPKSPRWLLMRGRPAEALAALEQFRMADTILHEPLMVNPDDVVTTHTADNDEMRSVSTSPTTSSRTKGELAAMTSAIAMQGESSLFDLVRVPVLRKALWIGCSLVLLQQLTGQPSLLYYGTVLFRQAGFQTRRQASLANLVLGAMKALSTIAAMATVDRLGRRILLLAGTAVMVVSLLVLAGVLTAYAPSASALHNSSTAAVEADAPVVAAGEDHSYDNGGAAMPDEVKWATLCSLAAYVCAYSFSYGPVVWLILSETFPDGIRARAMAVATLLNNLANFGVSASFLSLLSAIGIGGLCMLYAAVGIVAAVFISACVPETRGASLEQIQAMLLKPSPPWLGLGHSNGHHRYTPLDQHGRRHSPADDDN
eukprot:m.203636 g.203636  ORF g.203636 m.203636 type:complete len:653 (+) comp22186_c0_seq1:338-2296(+)